MLVHEKVRQHVFLDSDWLEDLENIFDLVKEDSASLVILLTRTTLQRMWCAGEIVTGFAHSVPVIPVATEAFQEIDSAFLDGLSQVWTSEQLSRLDDSGVALDDIRTAYSTLATKEKLRFIRRAPVAEHRAVVRAALDVVRPGKSGASLRTMKTVRPVENSCPPVVLCGTVADGEAIMAMRILQKLMNTIIEAEIGLMWEVAVTHTAQGVLDACEVLVVLLSNELLTDYELACAIARALDSGTEVVSLLPESGFAFPGPEFVVSVHEGAAQFLRKPGGSPFSDLLVSNDQLGQGFFKLFSILALPLSPKASASKIHIEVREISRRVKKFLKTPLITSGLETTGDTARLTCIVPRPTCVPRPSGAPPDLQKAWGK